MTVYTLQLDDSELARYAAMAAHAMAHEEPAWDEAGIRPGAVVADLGCGPGTFLPELARRVAPDGRVIAVDQDAGAVDIARAVAAHAGASDADLRVADVAATGLAVGELDTAFMRHVLIHNGVRLAQVLGHVGELLGGRGRLLSVEGDITGVRTENQSPEEAELQTAWIALLRHLGNDPAFGTALADAVADAGFRVRRAEHRVDAIAVERPPSWAAVPAMLAAGIADVDDVERWRQAIERRLQQDGPLRSLVPLYVVVADGPA